jgi:hypothetical protein
MTLRSIVCAAVLLAASPALAQKQVTLLATVTSPDGKPVGAVDPLAVKVTENDAAAAIVKVEPVNRVRKLHLLIDNGVGIPSEALSDLRKGVRGLLEAVPAGVQISLYTTAPQPRPIERGTPDREKALKAVDLITPDNGAGRYVEGLYELSERIERDKDSSNVVVAVATSSGDLRVRDDDVKKVVQRSANGRMKVYTVLFARNASSSVSGGDLQATVGESIAKTSGARFEKINASSRLATLLPEIGAELAATMGETAQQIRITVDRPGGQSGNLGRMSLGVSGLLVSSVNIESSR